jgi:hypothetical protein
VNEDAIKAKTNQSIQEMTLAFNHNREKVLKDILNAVCNVAPKPHENLVI